MTDNKLQAIKAYLTPSSSSISGAMWIIAALLIFAAVGGCIISGRAIVLIGCVPPVLLLLGFGFSQLDATERASSLPMLYAQKYGEDTLYNDFAHARTGASGDDFRLGQRFLYSKHASQILAYSEIESVRFDVSKFEDSADSYALVCTMKDLSSVTISTRMQNKHYVYRIKSHMTSTNPPRRKR